MERMDVEDASRYVPRREVDWQALLDEEYAIDLILRTDLGDIGSKWESRPSRKLDLDVVSKEFVHPIRIAANRLRVSSTSLKSFCRRNGITRWPYRRLQLIERFVRKLEGAIAEDLAKEGFDFVVSIPEGRDIVDQLESFYKEKHHILHPETASERD